MTQRHPVQGLWCATLTPLDRDGGVDHPRFARHAHWLLAQGVDGVAPFGTTGEGQSFSTAERTEGIDALLAAGIAPARVVAATGAAALTDTIALTRHGVRGGLRRLPGAAAVLLQRRVRRGPVCVVREADRGGRRSASSRVALSHSPGVRHAALGRSRRPARGGVPGIIAGVKDSAGDWAHTSALLARVPDLAILVGHEPHLPRLLRAGGAGTICGVANVFPALVRALMSPGVTAADEARIATFIDIAFRQPFLPAFKSIVAARTGDPGWLAVRPPLVGLADDVRMAFLDALAKAGLPVTPEGNVGRRAVP